MTKTLTAKTGTLGVQNEASCQALRVGMQMGQIQGRIVLDPDPDLSL